MDDDHSHRLESINALSRQARIALSAYVAERAIVVYEFGPYQEQGGDVLRRAVSLIWTGASGTEPDRESIAKAIEAVSAVVPPSEEDNPGFSAAILAGVTVLSALDSLGDPSAQSSFRSCLHQLSAYETVGDEESVQLEAQLQRDAIKILAHPPGPMSQSLFRHFPAPLADRFL